MNRNTVTVVTPEAAPLITLTELKTFLRVDGNDENSLITDFLNAAIDDAKNYTRRSFINRTLLLTLDGFPYSSNSEWWSGTRQVSQNAIHKKANSIEIPFPKLVSVSNITTYDYDNSANVFGASNYFVDTAGARVSLNQSGTWPVNLRDTAAVKVQYVSGYGEAASDVPPAIKIAIQMHVQKMYEMRQYCDSPESSMAMLNRYRILDGVSRNG